MDLKDREQTIQLLLLGDQILFRESLGRLLNAVPGFQVTAQCATPEEALDALARDSVNVALVDLDLGQARGHTFLRGARERGFGGRILLITSESQNHDAVELIRWGVNGIFMKQRTPELLVQAIRRLHAGEAWLDAPHVEALMRAAVAGASRSVEQFTERERRVLRGVVEGLGNREIGEGLQISESSVKSSLQQLFRKTGVRTRSQLVRVALEKRLDLEG
jgi:DNA-binding NarL/FixJ family response regulator